MDRDTIMAEQVILGLGFRQAARYDSFENALSAISPPVAFDAIAVPEDKTAHPALQQFANHHSAPIIGVSQTRLESITTPTQSDVIQKKRQTGSVAEAAALAILQSSARLLVKRCISEDRLAVCAVARGELR